MNSVEASNDGESTEAKTQFKKRRYQKTCESQIFKLNDRKNWPDHFFYKKLLLFGFGFQNSLQTCFKFEFFENVRSREEPGKRVTCRDQS